MSATQGYCRVQYWNLLMFQICFCHILRYVHYDSAVNAVVYFLNLYARFTG